LHRSVEEVNGEIRTVMFFCEEPNEVAHWWAELLSVPTEMVNDENGFCWFIASGTEYGFHPADDQRNPRGGTPVVYLASSDLEASMDRAMLLGATKHRGPLVLSPERVIAQLVDPFGNVFGIDGT
jgi:predicted enzyme related to lactoylglutathione lyase